MNVSFSKNVSVDGLKLKLKLADSVVDGSGVGVVNDAPIVEVRPNPLAM